jgi:hypothetical protein
MRAAVLALVAVLALGCGAFPAPTATPGAMDDVISALVLRGITIHSLASGDAGCPGSELHNNGVRLEVSIDNRSATHYVYLVRWRRPSDFADSPQAFADCIAEYQALNPGQTVSQVESEPWRAYGPGWAQDLGPRLLEALRASGGA